MKIGELFVQLGVTADTFTVRDFSKAIGDIPISVASAITAITGLGIGLFELTKSTLDISNNLGIFRSETGLSIIELQRWQAVAKQVGVSGDVVAQSIIGINNALAQIRLGHGEALLPLGRLGVDIRGKNAFQILQEIGKNSQRMDAGVATALMSQLGISPQMMRLFQLSPGQFNKMASVGPVIDEEQMKAMQDLQVAFGNFSIMVEKSFVPALTALEPYLKDLAEVLGVLISGAGMSAKGYGASASLINEVRKQGGISDFLENLSNSMLTPEMLHNQRFVRNEFNHTQNIYSTADPEEVARIAKENFTREKTKASKQFNNGGY